MTLIELTDLTRFEGAEGRLTKISSKRSNSQVAVSQKVTGDISVITWPATKTQPEQCGVLVVGMGISDIIRTSPVVKIVNTTENSTTFETQGGVYKLEKL